VQLRAVAALVARTEFQSLFAINGDLKSAVGQDLVCKRLQALCHSLLQFFIVQAEIQGIRNSGYGFRDILRMLSDSVSSFFNHSHMYLTLPVFLMK